MGKLITKVTDTIGLTDSGAGKEAAKGAIAGSELQAKYMQDALEYLKQQERLPTEVRESVLPQLAGMFGVPGYGSGSSAFDTGKLVESAQSSPLYQALMGGQQAGEEAILRNASATGGLRSGNVQSNLAEFNRDLQNEALLKSYQNELSMQDRQIGGLQSLIGLPSQASNIASLTSGIGQTLGQGITGATQSKLAGEAQTRADLMNIVGTGASLGAMFSDRRLKDNVHLIGKGNGHNVYQWTWNDVAAEKFNLRGTSFGVMADEVEAINPEAVSELDGFKRVNYDMIGVQHG